MIDFAKELNKEQYEAATAGDGPMLVLAAAGTGKTRTLVYRVAYLVERGVDPSRILLLTFTNRAAREMLERAEQVVGPRTTGIWSGTFHSVCARLLRLYGSFLGFKPRFEILDEDDRKKLVNDCIKQVWGKGVKDATKKEVIIKFISDAANEQRDFRALVESHQSAMALDVGKICAVAEMYAKRKTELGAMDFDDLLVNGLRLLKEVDSVREHLQETFLYVMVDEYQDTNGIQSEFTDILAARHRNLMVVGDDFQCIYTWRGAKFENIMRFPERWPNCKIVKLERNYRSLSPILDVANCVMKDVRHQFEKTLRPFRQSTLAKLPRLYKVWDGRSQAECIVKLAVTLHSQGVAWDDIAVLYRSHYTSIDIQMQLTRAHLPFKITSGVGVFEQLHVKDVLSFLRLCVDPRAELSFYRLLCLMPGVGEAGAKKYWVKLGKSFDGTNAMDRMNLNAMLPPRSRPFWQGIAKAFEQAPEHLQNGMDRLLVQDFVQLYYGDHLNRNFEEDDAEQRKADLDEITAHIADNREGVRGFLAEVALMTNLDVKTDPNGNSDHMHLTTIHQAKGMEWPVVILPWLCDTVFPSSKSIDLGNIDEERRLFYVAVTRAKDLLYMFAPKTKKTADGMQFPVEMSVFAREIPPQLVESRSYYTPPPENRRPSYDDDDDDEDGGTGGFSGRRWYDAGRKRGGSSSGGLKTTWRR